MDNDGELVFAAPSYMGEIAERARRVEELEQIIVKKDVILGAINEGIKNLFSTPSNQRTDEQLLAMSKTCEDALSLTPASVAQQVQEAHVGRAAIALRDKWRDRIKGDKPTTRKEEAMWRELVATIAEAIAKAREHGA